MAEKLDILAIGAHPDDVELAIGGMLWQHSQLGNRVGILDLTKGELGTRGTVAIRAQEAQDAAAILRVAVRENAGFADGFFKHDDAHIAAVVRYIRRWQPDTLIINAPADRHPDHGRANRICKDAWFMAGLQNLKTEWEGEAQAPWRPHRLFAYIQDLMHAPNLIVALSEDAFDKKMASIKAHQSQFYDPDSNEPETYIASKGFLENIAARTKHFGHMVSAPYGEALIGQRLPAVSDLSVLH